MHTLINIHLFQILQDKHMNMQMEQLDKEQKQGKTGTLTRKQNTQHIITQDMRQKTIWLLPMLRAP